MNRKNIGVIIPILIVVELSFLFLTCMSYSNKDVDKIKEVYKVDKKMFAMYVENESTGKYDEIKDSDSFPVGYRLNEEKTMCIDNKGDKVAPQVMSYNGKKLTVSSNKTIFCYIYFDLPLPDIKINNVDLTKLNTGKYIKSLDCGSNGNATYDTKYNRVVFNSIVPAVECTINYEAAETIYPTLKSIVEENGYDVGVIGYSVSEDATYTILENDSYGTITNTSTYPFVWDDVEKVWTQTSDTAQTSSYFKFYPSENGYYQICYELPSSAYTSSSNSYKNYISIYALNSTSSVKKTAYSNYNSGDTITGCYDYGYVKSSDYIYIKGYYYDNNISFYVNKTDEYEEINAGIRYTGKEPNNYIWFNNELWRIIGSIPTCTALNDDETCVSTENLVKIIRNESIGGLAYDAKSSGYTGDWGANTLYTLLNDYYYGKKNGTGTDYCYGYENTIPTDCDYRRIGINETSYYGNMIKEVYWNVGASAYNVSPKVVFQNEIKLQNIKGNIGIMNASDYGFAAASNYYNTSLYNYGSKAITGTNWLYGQNEEWTNTKVSTASAYRILSSGLSHYGYTRANQTVRPVAYLDTGIYVINSSEENVGTIVNPYKISIK